MTTKQATPSDSDTHRETIAEFRKTVNMTAGQLEKWLATDDSQRVGQKDGDGESVGHRSGQRIVELLRKKHADYTADDFAHMRKVIGYVRRHSAQGPTTHDRATSDWRYSLMNWGHDPEKD